MKCIKKIPRFLVISMMIVSLLLPNIYIPTFAQKKDEDDIIMKEDSNDWDWLANKLDHISEYTKIVNPDFSGAVNNNIPRTALLGNGDVGIASGGSSTEKRYIISKGDFWNAGYMDTRDTSVNANRKLKIQTVGGIDIKPQQPESGELTENMALSDNGPFSIVIVHEEQNIRQGTIDTEILINDQPIHMQTWLSATENVMVTQLTSQSENDIKLSAAAWAKEDISQDCTQESGIDDATDSVWASRKTVNLVPEHDASWSSEAVIRTSVVGVDDVQMEKTNSNSATVDFTVPAGARVYVVTSIGGGGQTYDNQENLRGADPLQQSQNILEEVTSEQSIQNLRQDHEGWWKDYWLKSYIDIPDEVLERYYYGSLYYMGATARADKMAPGLYGIWGGDTAQWCGDFHVNYNWESPFYGMYSSNRYEAVRAHTETLMDFMEQGEENSRTKMHLESTSENPQQRKNYMNSREDLADGIEGGILLPVGLAPWGNVSIERYMGQSLNAPFAAAMMISYFNYTQDQNYLQEVYPFLEKIAVFYEKWCEKEELGDGKYRYLLYDSSHESTSSLNFFGKNSGVTIGVVQNVYETLINNFEIVQQAGATEQDLAIWKDMYENMSDVPIRDYQAGSFNGKIFGLNEDESIMANRAASASVELEFVHPGERLGFDSDPYLLQVGRDTVTAKEAASSGTWGQINNTPKIYIQAIRLGYDPEYVINKFKTTQLNKMQKNFTINESTHGIEKAGAIEFINNMMLMSFDGIIKVFPNWIGEDASFTNLREKGAFLISSRLQDQKVEYIKLTSEAGQDAKVVIPAEWQSAQVTNRSGEVISRSIGRTKNSGEWTVEFATEQGEIYTITETLIDRDYLQEMVRFYEESAEEAEFYTEVSWKLFAEALETAQGVMTDESAAAELIAQTAAALKYAYDMLEQDIPITGITLSHVNMTTVKDRQHELKVSLYDEDGKDADSKSADIEWSSSDDQIIQVEVDEEDNKKAFVTAISEGQADITIALPKLGLSKSCHFIVLDDLSNVDSNIEITDSRLTVNEVVDTDDIEPADWLSIARDPNGGATRDVRKQGRNLISDLTISGNSEYSTDYYTLIKFSDGDSIESVDEGTQFLPLNTYGTGGAIFMRGVGKYFEFTVPVKPYEQTLTIFAGGNRSNAKLTAVYEVEQKEAVGTILKTNQAEHKVIGMQPAAHNTNKGGLKYSVTFRSDIPGEQMRIRYEMVAETNNPGDGQILLKSAILEGSPTIETDPDLDPQIGDITFSPSAPQLGEKVTVTATPKEGYRLPENGVKYNGKSMEKEENGQYSFIMPYDHVIITADFIEDKDYAIAVADLLGGKITADKTAAKEDELVMLTVTPDENFILKDGSIQAGSAEIEKQSESEYSFVMPAEDVTVTAEFIKEQKEQYKIEISQMSKGRVTADKSEAEAGETINLEVIPEAGYHLKEGSLQAGSAKISKKDETSYSFTMPEKDVTVTAEFIKEQKEQYKIEISQMSKGRVTADKSEAEAGETINLEVIPEAGYHLKEGSLQAGSAKISKKDETSYSFTMPEKDVTVTAEFIKEQKEQYKIEISQMSKGRVTANKSEAEAGEIINLTVSPESGYRLKAGTLKAGSAVISKKDESNYSFIMPGGAVRITAEFEVIKKGETVAQKVTSIKVTPGTKQIMRGKSTVCKVSVSPSNAANKAVSWKSSNTKVAVVNASGKVTAKSAGKVTITATAKDGSKISGKATLTVKTPVSKVKFGQTAVTLKEKKSISLPAIGYATDKKAVKLTYKSSKPKVAAVSTKGKITAKKAGKTVITAKADNGKSAKLNVTVQKKNAKTVKVTKVSAKVPKTMKVGQTKAITGKYSSTKATAVKVSYKSSKKAIVSVDKSGTLVAKKKGKAIITVKAGNKSKKYTIQVK